MIGTACLGRAGPVSCVEENRSAYRGLVAKPEGKSPPGRTTPRWDDSES
jgi:hypothetical protein